MSESIEVSGLGGVVDQEAEAGRAVAQPGAPGVMSARVDDEGRIAIDLECVGCQYNLRMCAAEGRCPECGLAVGRSAVGRYMCYHEPKWVQCLAWGMNRFAVALGAAALSVVLLIAANSVFGYVRSTDSLYWGMLTVAFVLLAVTAGFGILGLARATWPDPSPVTPEPMVNARRLMRICFVLGCVLPFVASGVAALEAMFGVYSYYREPAWGTSAAILLMGFAWLGVMAFLLLHARKLAVMIPRVWLGRWTLAVMVLVGITGFVVLGLWDNWFGWYDAAVLGYEALWPTNTGANSSVNAGGWLTYYGLPPWQPGDPWHRHQGFVELLELVRPLAWIGFGVSVLGIVPLFLVYWAALHKEARKAKATWAASPFVPRAVDESSDSDVAE